MVGAVVGAAALGSALAFGPIVRSRVAKEAARRNLAVDVGTVRPGWFAVRLLDVHVRPLGTERVDATLGEIRVELTGGFSVEKVQVRGGELRLRGELGDISHDLEASKGEPRNPIGESRAVPVTGEAISVRWSISNEREIEATGAGFARVDGVTKLSLELARVTDRELTVSFGGASVELDASRTLRSAHAATLEVEWRAPHEESPPPPASSAPAALPPPIVMAKNSRPPKRGEPAHAKGGAPPPPEVRGPLVPLPDLRAWRLLASALAARVAERIPDAVSVSVDALTAKATRDGNGISFGPGPFTISRRETKVDLQFTSTAGSGGTPLSLHASLPIDKGDVSLSLEGGPVALSVLGIKDGTAGLTDVDRATLAGKAKVVLADDALTFDGELRARGAAIRQARIASDVVRGLDVALGARGVLSDKGELRLDDFTATLGALHLSASGTLKQSDEAVSASFRFDVPTASCQSLLESMPSALLPSLRGAKYSGTLGARGTFSFDSRAIDDLVLSYDIQDQCRIVEAPPALARERFKQSFTHRIYLPDGTLSEETTGPGTSKWVPFGAISPFMVVAVLTTEDGGFYRHKGFSHSAIRHSIIANLKARRFVRGASTISMQLAKNLFLLREKTLSRKLEEVLLTDYLEQVFTKDELMELYLNVIEYAPNVYGIGPASYHYFGRSPSELNLAESLFLSSMLPAPLRLSGLKNGGQLSEGWQRTIVHLMTIAKKSGLISEEELEEGKNETVVFYKTGPRGPARRHSQLDAPADDDTQGQLQESD